MKKLLLGALLVVGSISYGEATASTEVKITANVVATGSIEVRQGDAKVTDLVYDGTEEVLNVVFTSTNKTTLQTITAKDITMKNGDENEQFLISVNANNSSVTLEKQDLTKVDDGNFNGTLIVKATYQ
ncbi:hypothetical protein [Psychrilyobacter atlanticus]|uniref:hypothetical protein n=1 Tax=Psychrilyobacter atlanticus TaxID=271091 RepID=UPI0004276F62|nr:hypothetical protein [Psychrilyobacter atlanticus]